MLRHLAIRNVVLIGKLDLEFGPGLIAFTGETGAGKSILLDALGLATGMRADTALIRHGQEQASVTASFDVPPDHPVQEIVAAQGIAAGEEILLRRQIGADGRSRAFLNGEPVAIGILRKIGAALIEIEGQFEMQGLFDPARHLYYLDQYAGIGKDVARLKGLFETWRQREDVFLRTRADFEAARREEDYLRHTVAELELVAPGVGEESALIERRSSLLQQGQAEEALAAACVELGGDRGADRMLAMAYRRMERWEDVFPDLMPAFERATLEMRELVDQVDRARRGSAQGSDQLRMLEERLFLLHDLARKHRIGCDELPALLETLGKRLAALENGQDALAQLEKDVAAAKAAYRDAAQKISARRTRAARQLDRSINEELPSLKLERARFETRLDEMAESDWGARGWDGVQFMISTNPGTPAAPIDKIASGGELARLMLAIKVTLAKAATVPCLVFDEVDTGIGGATAAAVGERLKRLATLCQVLVVTHSPQVAALADQHLRVQKSGKSTTHTDVALLDQAHRQEEIARMLSGATITDEARAAASKLLAGSL
ncbi:MAG TPA: DNA repair protein RecN [Dongiaceae bacterium]|jgi:DNA repair protein RecN (Recombination protein N)|nr:DNA repair protein RecN [Dongiaceae bacterium]